MRLGVIAMAKSDRPGPSGKNEAAMRRAQEVLITGTDPADGAQMDREGYLLLLQNEAMAGNADIVQGVQRVLATALHSLMLKQGGNDVDRFYLEGVVSDWGTRKRNGSATYAAIDAGVIPDTIRTALEPAFAEPWTNRTSQEFQVAMRVCRERGTEVLRGITSGYHVTRAGMIGAETAAEQKFQIAPTMWTPEMVVTEREKRGPRVQPDEQFLIDAIKAATLSLPQWTMEAVKEYGICRPLHRVSRWGKRLTGRDLEGWLADKKRGKTRAAA
jgi:hypothetical protein